jgi:septum formation protein
LILASASPRRRELLAAAGLSFIVRPADVDERPYPDETPAEYACRLAREKADAVDAPEEAVVLGADTVVVLEEHLLEKPRDPQDAARMLRLLSGRTHEVITGICLRLGSRRVVDLARTRVEFAALSAREIEAYVASGEPMDKAGAYGIQGLASKFVERVDGCYFNVVGLPLALVYRHLKALGAVEE